ncbi:MAG: FHIPEP family type III secretion protein [Planctomycetaceae bacterium]|nr:FHIPEP family type III secretion protein [Planctomycetaceae bacterium]
MPPSAVGPRSWLRESRGMIFPVLIVASVVALVTPLPPMLMDLLLAANITASVLILLTTVYVGRPLEFSSFPAILLGTTLVRLVLNVASTRLVLTRGGTDGTQAAGKVIEAFSQFVAGDQIAVGIVIFLIVVAIQFLVITKGATRISEVAARFALDGLPGKQMGIDADLNAGAISHEQARQRRDDLIRQADFYAAMDGASKFVRGDAVAGLVILAVNIVGGLYMGVFENDMPIGDAADVFTRLTIGDGLVSQVPAFLISLAAGLIVTRSSSESDLRRDVIHQTFRHPEALFLAAAFLSAMSFTGLPALPLIAMAAGCAIVGTMLRKTNAQAMSASATSPTTDKPPPKVEDFLRVDPMELTIGPGLVTLAQSGDLLAQISAVRTHIAHELGMLLPKMRIKDNLRSEPFAYELKLRGIPVATGEARVDRLLAIRTTFVSGELPGQRTVDPATGRPAIWIEPAQRDRAELLGYLVQYATEALFAHLHEVVREHAAELLTRQQVHGLLDNLRLTSPKVVDELVPSLLKPALVHQVLEHLLRERVPIRDLETILETLADYAGRTQNPVLLTEYVRSALARAICQRHRDAQRVLHVLTLDPDLEDLIAAGVDFNDTGLIVKLSLATSDAIRQSLTEMLAATEASLVLTTTSAVRLGLRHITATEFPRLTILSLNDISRDTQVESLGQIGQPFEADPISRPTHKPATSQAESLTYGVPHA